MGKIKSRLGCANGVNCKGSESKSRSKEINLLAYRKTYSDQDLFQRNSKACSSDDESQLNRCLELFISLLF